MIYINKPTIQKYSAIKHHELKQFQLILNFKEIQICWEIP